MYYGTCLQSQKYISHILLTLLIVSSQKRLAKPNATWKVSYTVYNFQFKDFFCHTFFFLTNVFFVTNGFCLQMFFGYKCFLLKKCFLLQMFFCFKCFLLQMFFCYKCFLVTNVFLLKMFFVTNVLLLQMFFLLLFCCCYKWFFLFVTNDFPKFLSIWLKMCHVVNLYDSIDTAQSFKCFEAQEI